MCRGREHCGPRRHLRGDPDPDTGQVTLYDDRSGNRLPSGLADGDEVVALSPAARLTIAYVVRPAGSTAGTTSKQRTCDLATDECMVAADLPNRGETPVLAR